MATITTVNPATPLKYSGAIQVPLFDPPYKVWDNFGGVKTAVPSPWPVYSYNLPGIAYRAAILTATKVTTFQIGASFNGAVPNAFIHFGTTAVAINGQTGATPSPILMHLLVPGGPSINPSSWPINNVAVYPLGGQSNQTGWGRSGVNALTLAWFDGNLYISNITLNTGQTSYLVNLFTPWQKPIVQTSPSGPAGSFSVGNSFQLPATKSLNQTLMWMTGGTHLVPYIYPVVFNALGQIVSLVATLLQFDNAALNTFIAAGANYNISFGNYGVLIWWGTAGGGPVFFPKQSVQAILLSINVANNYINNNLISGQWASLQFLPQTSLSNGAIKQGYVTTAGRATYMQIDPSGIFYYDPGSSYQPTGYNGSYIANSFGLDISIPGISLLPKNNGIPLQAYCPCSPVAIGGSP